MGKSYYLYFKNDASFIDLNKLLSNEQTYWMTTGLFPQSLVISFPQTVEIKALKLSSYKSNILFRLAFYLY